MQVASLSYLYSRLEVHCQSAVSCLNYNILFYIILIIGKTPANCIYAVFNIKSDIAAAQQLYIGNDFMSKEILEIH